ncbi:MAG: hypothetical protein Q7S33_05595 [Nanoarchaeota archaeon]|nr:hypothetical protein [Nanoarchaeota archaeon]
MAKKIWASLFLSFLLTLIIYSALLAGTTFKNSSEEISCVHGLSDTGFSNGIWRGNNPWSIIIGAPQGETAFLNCDCGIFGEVQSKDNDLSKPVCVYYKRTYLNNKERCLEYKKEFKEFNGAGDLKGICICNGNADDERGDVCLPRDSWENYNKDLNTGIWSNRELGGILKPHLITSAAIFILLFILVYIYRILFPRNKKE